MFLGHYGVAFAARRAAPRMSLGTLTLAAQWLDELWPILLLAGVEHVRVVPGLMRASPADFVWYPYSHSLAMAIVWGALFALIYFAARRDRRSALIVGGAVVSHWLLDLPMHRPDLPLWPGSRILLGAGAWNSIPLTILLEGGVFVLGLWLYLRSTRATDRTGTWSLWAMVAVLVAIFASGFFNPPPPSEHTVAVATLMIWLFVPWSYWIDRHRALIDPAPRA